MSCNLSEALLYIDTNFATVTRNIEHLNVKVAVEKVLEDVATKIGEVNELYVNHIIPSGSTYEGTKVLNPDEFDLMVCLDALGNIQEQQEDNTMRDLDAVNLESDDCAKSFCVQNDGTNVSKVSHYAREPSDQSKCIFNVINNESLPGHVYIEVLDTKVKDKWKTYTREHNDKICLNVTDIKHEFSQLAGKAVEMVEWPDNLKFLISTTNFGDIVPFKPPEELTLKWKDTMKISIDVVPCISLKRSKSLENLMKCKHLRETYDKDVADLLCNILQEEGLLAVGRIDIFWRLSWSAVEMRLMQYLSKHAPNALACYRIMKYLNEVHFMDDCEPPKDSKVINSYPLKNILFHTWAKHSCNKDTWLESAVGERVIEMLGHLANAFRTNRLSCFFMPQKNLFQPGTWNAPAADAVEKLITQLEEINNWEEDIIDQFISKKIQVRVPKPPKKLSDYNIRQIKPGDHHYRGPIFRKKKDQ